MSCCPRNGTSTLATIASFQAIGDDELANLPLLYVEPVSMSSNEHPVYSHRIYSIMYKLYTMLIVMGCTICSCATHNNRDS